MKRIFTMLLALGMMAAAVGCSARQEEQDVYKRQVMTTSVADVSVQAADFTDEGSNIKYGEAVDVVSALNIMDKSSDGTFAPEDMLTRGEAAKILCNMMSGNIDAYTGNTAFSDVPADNIYAPYIEYCAANGIVSGYGDGTFHPDGFVTGDEFLKMLLVALGYDGAEEGISGSSWAAQVELLANDLGLTKGNDDFVAVSYTHLDVYKRQGSSCQ